MHCTWLPLPESILICDYFLFWLVIGAKGDTRYCLLNRSYNKISKEHMCWWLRQCWSRFKCEHTTHPFVFAVVKLSLLLCIGELNTVLLERRRVSLPDCSAYLNAAVGGFVRSGFRTWEEGSRCAGLVCLMTLRTSAHVFGGRLLLVKSASKEIASKGVSSCKLGWWHHPEGAVFWGNWAYSWWSTSSGKGGYLFSVWNGK